MDDLLKLYNAVSANFDIGSFDQFRSKMETPEDRKKFYDVVNKNGFDLGDYNEYENRLKKSGGGFTTVIEKRKEQKRAEETGVMVEEVPAQEFVQTTEAEDIKIQKREKKQREEQQELLAEDYSEIINNSLESISGNISNLEQDYIMKEAIESGDWEPISEEDFKEKERLDSMSKDNIGERLDMNRKSKELLDLSKQYIETKDEGFFDAIQSKFDKEFVTMGISSLVRDFDLVGIARKYKDNPESISDEETNVLLSYGMLSDVKENMDSSRGYKVGSSVMESIPFMVQFALGGQFTAPAKALGKKALKKGLKKNYAKLLSKTTSSVLRTTGLAPTVAMGVEERMIGNIDVAMEDGQAVPKVREGTQEGLAEAIGKSWTQAYISVVSEGLGTMAKPASSYLFKKVGLSKFDDYVKSLSKTEAGKLLDKVQVQGIPVEFGEEIAEKYLNKAILNEGSWGFEKGELLNTLLAVSVIRAPLSLTGSAQLATEKISAIKENKIRKEEGLLTETRTEVDKILSQDKDIKEIGNELNDYIDKRIGDGLDREGVKKIIDYASAKVSVQTIDELQTLKTEEDESKIGERGSVQEPSKEAEEERGERPEGVGRIHREEEIREEEIPEVGRKREIKEKEEPKDAVQEQITDEGVLRQERPEVGLQEVGKKDKETKVVAREKVEKEEKVQEVVEKKEEVRQKGLAELGITEYKPKKVSVESIGEGKIRGKLAKAYGEDTKKYEVSYEDKKVGQIETAETENEVTYLNVSLEKGRGIGIGKDMLRNLNEQVSEQKKQLVSSQTQSKEQKRVWESLVKTGEAEKMDDGRYRMKSVEKEIKKPKKIIFESFGEQRKGEVLEEGVDYIKVKDDKGIKHTIKKGDPRYHNIRQQDIDRRVMDFSEKERQKKEAEPKQSTFAFTKPETRERVGARLQRLFEVDKGAPKGTARRALKMKGRIASQNFQARNIIKEYSNAVKQVYGKKIPKKEAEKLDYALKSLGNSEGQYGIALEGIDQRLHDPLIKMRRHIDYMTSQLKEIPWLSNTLQATFDANTGYYVTRSYQAKNNPQWTWENINQDVKDEAFKSILQNFPELTDKEAEGILKSMLLSDDVSGLFGKDATLGKMNLGITKARSQFLTDNPAIREFLGEFKDPVINYATSINKMANLLEKHRFLTDITKQGVESGVLTEEITDKNNVKVGVDHPFSMMFDKNLDAYKIRKGKTYKSLKPINEYYTTPEIKKALEEFDGAQQKVGTLYKLYLAGTSAVKGAKTAGSVRGIIRNFWSNPINSVANANWNVVGTLKEMPLDFSSRKSFKESFDEMIKELQEEAMLGQQIDKRAIEENIREISRNRDIIKQYTDSKLKKIGKMPIDIAWKAFSFGDDFWKAQRYYSEKAKYRKTYEKTMSKEEAEKKAREKSSEILHRTQAFYDLLPKFAQMMRKAPVTGSFISFPYVTTMNIANTIDLAVKEMKSKETFHIGLQRAMGTLGALSVLPIIAKIINDGNDVDDDDMQMIRKFVAPYWENDVLAIKKKKGDGVFTYSNLSFVDFYSAVNKPVLTMVRDLSTGDFDERSVINAVKEFIEPYVDPEISAQLISDLFNNHSKRYDRKIYDPKSDTMVGDIFKYVWEEGLMPGTINDIKTIKRLKRHDRDWKSHLKGMVTGFQKRELDIKRSFKNYNMKDYLDDIQFYKERYSQSEYKEGGKAAEKALKEANENITRIIEEARTDFDALMKLGVEYGDAINLLKESRNSNGWLIPKMVFMSIVTGTDIELTDFGKLLPKMEEEPAKKE